MSAALDTLTRMNNTLTACVQGTVSPNVLIQQWRSDAALLALPERFGVVLGNLLDRLESSALFSEESCSFSQKDLLGGLQMWADKARAQLPNSQVGGFSPDMSPLPKPTTSELKLPTYKIHTNDNGPRRAR